MDCVTAVESLRVRGLMACLWQVLAEVNFSEHALLLFLAIRHEPTKSSLDMHRQVKNLARNNVLV